MKRGKFVASIRVAQLLFFLQRLLVVIIVNKHLRSRIEILVSLRRSWKATKQVLMNSKKIAVCNAVTEEIPAWSQNHYKYLPGLESLVELCNE